MDCNQVNQRSVKKHIYAFSAGWKSAYSKFNHLLYTGSFRTCSINNSTPRHDGREIGRDKEIVKQFNRTDSPPMSKRRFILITLVKLICGWNLVIGFIFSFNLCQLVIVKVLRRG